jgi:uroporphyrinogen decarboxylase
MQPQRTVVIVVTLDTKGPAAQFLRDEIESWGVKTILIDPGILGEPAIQADITRWQVAETAGTTLEALIVTGKKMKLIVQLGYIFMGAWQLMGIENFAYQLADDPEFVGALVDQIGANQMAVLEMLLQYGCVGAIWLPDDLAYNSGPMVSPRVLQKYIYPWYRRMVARCRQAGIPVGLHSDGDLTRLLPDLVACGFDGIHPIEPPVNDIFAIKDKWGGSIALAGNIDLKQTLCTGSPETVAAEVRDKAARLAPGGGWLVGSSNSIPDFVPLENYQALLKASLEYGSYP